MRTMKRDNDILDEEQVPGKGMGFGFFLATIQGGNLHHELTKNLADMGAALNQHFLDYGGTPKGEIELKIKFKLDKGVVHVLAERKVKAPKMPEFGELLFIDGANNLCQDNPRQMNMGFERSRGRGPRPVDD